MALAKILFVDDEDFVLKAVSRFCCESYDVHTAKTADEAVRILTEDQSYAAVVTDLRMPGMSGIDFLRHAHQFAPSTTRILLTGQLETADALRAVNEGRVFQILLKPCPVPTMLSVLGEAVRHHKGFAPGAADLEDEALRENIMKMLSEVLALASPLAASRSARLKKLALGIADHMGVQNCVNIERAAGLSQLGCIGVPLHTLASLSSGADQLSEREVESLDDHPAVGKRLLSYIPHLSEVARAIGLQLKNFDGSGSPDSGPSGEDIPLASRILRAAVDFDDCTRRRLSPTDALIAMGRNAGRYDPKVLVALKAMHSVEETTQLFELDVDAICIGMTLECAVGTTDGRTLLAKGSHVTESMLARLRAFARNGNLQQPILVSGTVSRVAAAPTAAPVATELPAEAGCPETPSAAFSSL